MLAGTHQIETWQGRRVLLSARCRRGPSARASILAAGPIYLTRCVTQYLYRRDAAPPEFERQLETRGAPLVSSEQFAVRTKPYEAEHVVPEFLVDQQEVGSEVAVTAAGPVAG